MVNLLQDADEASLPAILNCMHFLCDNDPAAQVTSACAATATAFPRAGVANRLLHTERVTPVAQTLLRRFGAPRLLAAHLLRSGMQVTRREWLLRVLFCCCSCCCCCRCACCLYRCSGRL